MRTKANWGKMLRLLVIDLAVLLILRITLGLAGCFEIPESRPAAAAVQDGVHLPVIMYHSIRKGPESGYAVTPETLESDLAYLRSGGWESVSPDDLVRFVRDGLLLPEKPILLTFDDGFYNNLCYAVPLLEQYGFCATVNIVGEFSQELAPADPHVPAYSYLTAPDLQEMQASGHISFGNHTSRMHHRGARMGCRIRADESEAAYRAVLRKDLADTQLFLHHAIGEEPTIFAYPYGFECPEALPVLQEMGFYITLTCYEGDNYLTSDPACLRELRRWNRAGNQSSEVFFSKVFANFSA